MFMDLPPSEPWKSYSILRELRPRVVATCEYDAKVYAPGQWGVVLNSTSSGGIVHHVAYIGDIPLLPAGAYSTEIAKQLQIVADVSKRLPPPK